MKIKIIALLFYILSACLLVEALSRIAIGSSYFRKFYPYCNASQRLCWVRCHDKTALNIFYKFDIFDPIRGWALKPGLRNMPIAAGKILNSNLKGIRGTKEYEYAKPADKKRIAVLGDSFTFGEEVSDNETYSYYLQELLPDTEVINFGVHGYAHDQMLLYLENEVLKYNPDIVILGFIDDDMARNLMNFRDYAKPRFELRNDTLYLKDCPVPPPETIIRTEAFRLKFIDLLSMAWSINMHKSGFLHRQKKKLTAAILDRMVSRINSSGAIALLVHMPMYVDGASLRRESGYLFSYCRARRASCMSVYPDFLREVNNGESLVAKMHWTSRGHKITAQAIKNYLLNTGLLQQPD